MKKLFAAVAVAFPIVVACGSEAPSEPAPGKTDEAVKVCTKMPIACTDPGCQLVGDGCPQQCVCNGVIQCGTKSCGPNQYCCNSTVVGYECLNIGEMCPY